MKRVGEIVRALEARAPSELAEDWDNVGLLAGDPSWETPSVVVSIDLTQGAIDRAVATGAKLIINHHPCIFPRQKGLSRVVPDGASSLVFEALRHGIAVYSTHTNFDQCALEVPQVIAQALGLNLKGRLFEKQGQGEFLKLAVFVPETHAEQVRAALTEAGTGRMGHYDRCSFQSEGEGSYRALNGAQPFLGKVGVLERTAERKIETLVARGDLPQVLKAMRKAHPYEEIAYDLYPVEQEVPSVGLHSGLGYGFYGDFDQPKAFSLLAQHVKAAFQVSGFWVSEPVPQTVKRVGFVAGKGASFMGAAASVGCDLFITGEAGYHVMLDGARRGVAVMELGHRESEYFFVTTIAGWLSEDGVEAVMLRDPTQRIYTAD